MPKQVIGIGTTANDGTGDALRDAFDKSNDNFTELYDNLTTTTAGLAVVVADLDALEITVGGLSAVSLIADNDFDGLQHFRDEFRLANAADVDKLAFAVGTDTADALHDFSVWGLNLTIVAPNTIGKLVNGETGWGFVVEKDYFANSGVRQHEAYWQDDQNNRPFFMGYAEPQTANVTITSGGAVVVTDVNPPLTNWVQPGLRFQFSSLTAPIVGLTSGELADYYVKTVTDQKNFTFSDTLISPGVAGAQSAGTAASGVMKIGGYGLLTTILPMVISPTSLFSPDITTGMHYEIKNTLLGRECNLLLRNTVDQQGAAIYFWGDADTDQWYLASTAGLGDGSPSANGLRFGQQLPSNVPTVLMLANGGNVGVGTAIPSQKLHVAGNALLDGPLMFTPQALSGTGALAAVNITTGVTTIVTTGAATTTLAAGTDGLEKTLSMITDGGDMVVTVTNLQGGTTLTFGDEGDTITLLYVGAKWKIKANTGVVIA